MSVIDSLCYEPMSISALHFCVDNVDCYFIVTKLNSKYLKHIIKPRFFNVPWIRDRIIAGIWRRYVFLAAAAK